MRLPGNIASVSSVNGNLSVCCCCSVCLVSSTVALSECVEQMPGRGDPWQDVPYCQVTNVATAGFLLSCKKFKWRRASVHMGCYSPTDSRMPWYGPDS